MTLTVQHGNEEFIISSYAKYWRDTALNDVPIIQFTAISDGGFNPAYPYLNEDVVIKSDDGHEYRAVVFKHKNHYKTINAVHIVTDLKGVQFENKLTGTFTATQVFGYLFAGTDFALELDETGLESVHLMEWGNKNRWSLFLDANKLFGTEFLIQPNNIVAVKKQFDIDRGKRFIYGYNVNDITKETDSTNVHTRIRVRYGEKLVHHYEYISPHEAAIGRIRYADPIEDEQLTTQEEAIQKARYVLEDVPKLVYTVNIAQLGEGCVLGETVYTQYEPLDNLDITTRILKIREEWNGRELVATDATVGNSAATKLLQSPTERVHSDLSNRANKTDETVKFVKKQTAQAIASIEVLDEEIELKVNKDGVISAINISPETIQIQAPKINLTGAVMVNGSITGSTNINIMNDVYVGNNIYMQGAGTSAVHFADNSYIQSISGGMYLEAWNSMIIHAPYVIAFGVWDFSNATVTGI